MCRIPVASTTGALTRIDLLAICTKIREVSGASAAYLFHFGLWLSLVERLVRDQEAVGSNPTSPIKLIRLLAQSVATKLQTVLRYSPDLAKDELSGAVALDTAYYEALWRYGLTV